jgi:serine protease Do
LFVVNISVIREPRSRGERAPASIGPRPFARLAATLGAVVLMSASMGARAADGPRDFSDLSERLVPSVVNISTTQEVRQRGGGGGQQVPQFPPGSPFEEFFRDFFDRRGEEQPDSSPAPRTTSLGSGFVVDASGYIVTNNHVIADAAEITVIFADGETLPATLVGHDPKTDVALLKVEPEEPLPFVNWGNSDGARVGNWVVAIGNPFGLGNSVTAGIISARARDINAGPFDDFLQTDASINRGNSGGPLFNMDGHVIGINTAIYSPSGGSVGIGFAVPSNLAKNVVHQLREYGETRRGWLGVRIQTVTEDLAMSLGLDSTNGALVASVSEGSPAEDAGLKVGDVIRMFDGKSVDTMRRLPRIVAETQIGSEVEVEIWRDGEPVTVGVTVGRLDESDAPQVASATPEPSEPVLEEIPELGLTLSRITGEIREQFELGTDAKGVMVVHVEAASAAAEKGVKPGDLIVEVGQKEVASPDDVTARIKEHRDQDKNTVLLLLDRNGALQFVAVRLADS